MYVNYRITGGLNPDIDSSFKDFALLYTFGNFAFFNELYDKVTDFDETSELIWTYKI